jgi:hypothetical protein
MGKVMRHAVANNPRMAFRLFMFLDRPVYLGAGLVSERSSELQHPTPRPSPLFRHLLADHNRLAAEALQIDQTPQMGCTFENRHPPPASHDSPSPQSTAPSSLLRTHNF